MSAWMGLANPDLHKVEDGDDFAGCSGCFEECSADWPCRCCLAAEVERLSAIVQRVEALREKWDHDMMVTLGKVLPGGVLSVPLQSVEHQLSIALRGESDE